MMKINWTVRIYNPTWWAQVVSAIVLPLIVGVGFEWIDMTSWATLGDVLLQAIGNPVVVVATIISLFNAITDPTTTGVGDSNQAMGYKKPKGE